MVTEVKSWVKENSALVYFLVGQLIIFGTGAASVLAYMVKLEVRVHTMETRGAEYTVARMSKIDERITIIEQKMTTNENSIRRLVDRVLQDTK